MISRLHFELPSNATSRSERGARALRRGTGLALTLVLLEACGGPSDPARGNDGYSNPTNPTEGPSPPLDPHEVAMPAPDFDVARVQNTGLFRPSGPPSAVVARTHSVGGALDSETRRELLRVGRIEHTFSDGRIVEFVNSDVGNFGTGDEILGPTEKLAEYIEGMESAGTLLHSLPTDDDDDTWPNGLIPFEIDGNVTGSDRTEVLNAVTQWNQDNPYVKWTSSNGSGDRVSFVKSSSTDFCGRSPVGRSFAPFGPQEIEVVCFDQATLLHEMGHAAGLNHEHQRCGRDAFVRVHDDPATGDGPRGNDYDELCGDSRNYGDYDYASLLHYRPTEFMDILSSPTGVFMGLPSSPGTMSRLSQDDVNGVTWLHTKKTFSTTSGYGFAWAQQTTGTFDAASSWSWNSAATTGAKATITRLGMGRFRVLFPKLGKEAGGNVQVTAYGTDATRCKAESWSSNTSTENLQVIVRCVTPQGALVDSLFDVWYQRSVSPLTGPQGGYLYSNRINEPGAYTPDMWYQWNTAGQRNRVTRTSDGSYDVEFPGINVNGGTVQVTAVGTTSDYCTISGWGNALVSVNCFDTAGNAKDSAFSISFTESYFPGTFAFAWADQPTSDRYEPSSFYQKVQISNVGGAVTTPITVNRSGTGDYRLEIPGVAPFASAVSVTAYGSNNTCKDAGWGANASVGPNIADRRESVSVRCFDPSGNPADSLFAIRYLTNEIIIP